MERLQKIRKLLRKHSQEHLLMKYDELDKVGKKQLLDLIETIDFDLMERLYQKATTPVIEENSTIEPISYIDKDTLAEGDAAFYKEIGKTAIKYGKVAAVTMAGGQGTRLGHNGPKGTFDIGLDSHKSLFELLCDSLKEAGKKYGVTIPWFFIQKKTKVFLKRWQIL